MADPTFLPAHTNSDPFAPHLLAAAQFLANYTKRTTREAYALDMRIYYEWCAAHGLDPLKAQRLHIQAFAIHLTEVRRNAPASVARRVGTVASFYRECVFNGYVAANPVMKVRLPEVHDDPRKKTWLNRYEIAALERQAKATSPAYWAMTKLMSTIGMRVTAVCDARIEHMSQTDDGYRVLETVGKGSKPSVKVLPIPVCLAVDAAIGGRREGWLIRRRDGSQMTRRSASAAIEVLARRAGIHKKVTPHMLRRSCATNLLKNGTPLLVVQDQLDHSRPDTTLIYNALGVELHAQASNIMAAMIASAS